MRSSESYQTIRTEEDEESERDVEIAFENEEEKDKYGYPLENCDVTITLKDNQVFRGKYDPSIGFMTSDGRMIWKENVLSYRVIKE